MKLDRINEMLLAEKSREDKNINDAPAPDGNEISTAQAAKIMGVSMSRVRQYIQDGRLKSKHPEKGRRDNVLSRSEVEKLAAKDRKPTGRPEGSKKQ